MPSYKHAINHLNNGELIVIPTETVYGIAVDATNPLASEKIFSAKQRPNTRPIQIMTHHIDHAFKLGNFNATARLLAQKFWPGGLTLIVTRSPSCGLEKTLFCGTNTIGIRIPDHPIMLTLLTKYAKPLAVSSANISGASPTTTAAQARTIFPALTLLDGGDCTIGTASTVIDCTEQTPKILRHGAISQNTINQLLQQ